MFELSTESYRNDDYTLYQFNLTTGLPYSEIPGNTHSIHFVRLHLIKKKYAVRTTLSGCTVKYMF